MSRLDVPLPGEALDGLMTRVIAMEAGMNIRQISLDYFLPTLMLGTVILVFVGSRRGSMRENGKERLVRILSIAGGVMLAIGLVLAVVGFLLSSNPDPMRYLYYGTG